MGRADSLGDWLSACIVKPGFIGLNYRGEVWITQTGIIVGLTVDFCCITGEVWQCCARLEAEHVPAI